ncbi:MAG: hypothetical protein EA404_13235 [Spirochaetaceae bacterium]|nr:MAG: hypothetical protein EA404_13235 [Spirochaetaceae bacterium]
MGKRLTDRLHPTPGIMAFIAFALVLYLFWLVIAGNISVPVLLAGIPIVLAPIFLFRWTNRAVVGSPIPLRFLLLGPFIVRTAWEMVKAAIQVAGWTLRVRLPLRSWIFAYPTEIEDRLGLMLLSSAITLTPGTISVELDRVEKVLHIHALAPYDTSTEEVAAGVRLLERALMRALP